jgi:hypothetical protein
MMKGFKGWYFYGLAAVVFVIALGLVPGLHLGEATSGAGKAQLINDAVPRSVAFVGALGGTLLILIGIGVDVSESWLGVLESGRNTYSLSRLQMALWTWLVLSALFAAAACRAWGLGGGNLNTALDVDINSQIFEVMGLSFFTGAAVPALLALKSQGGSDPNAAASVSAKTGETMQVQGQVIVRPDSSDPKLGDLVQGDDVGSAGVVDLSKVQQLLITLLLVGTYAAMLFGLFADGPFVGPNSRHTVLPPFPDNFVGLLALSHGGYLAYKALPKPAAGVPAGPPAAPVGR